MPKIFEYGENLKVVGLAGEVKNYQKYLNIPEGILVIKIPRDYRIRFTQTDPDMLHKVKRLFKKKT